MAPSHQDRPLARVTRLSETRDVRLLDRGHRRTLRCNALTRLACWRDRDLWLDLFSEGMLQSGETCDSSTVLQDAGESFNLQHQGIRAVQQHVPPEQFRKVLAKHTRLCTPPPWVCSGVSLQHKLSPSTSHRGPSARAAPLTPNQI